LKYVDEREMSGNNNTRAEFYFTFSGNFVNRLVRFLGHVTKNRENDESSEEACHTVDGACSQRIPI